MLRGAGWQPALGYTLGVRKGVRAGSPRLVKMWGGVFVVVGAGWQPALG